MHIVVVGNGKIGKAIIVHLVHEGHDVVVIDSNEACCTEAQNGSDVMCICGNGASSDVQLQAGVADADLLIAVTAVDEVNLLCCLIAKKLGAKRTVARVRNPEYSDELSLIRDDLGLSMAINPEYATARDIFSVLRFPGLLTIEKFANGKVELAEFRIAKNSPITGMSLNDINRVFKIKLLICAVRRNGETYIPNGDFVLESDDRVSFTAAPDETEKFLRASGINVHPPKNVIIVGASRVSYYLTRMLNSIHVNPTIIESNLEKCRTFSAAFPHSLVILGDGADRELLSEEGIQSADAFVSVTGTDEVNILLSTYATSQKVPKVVTKVSRFSMIELVGEESVGSIVSPKDITASQIISFVRAMEKAEASNVETLYRIVDGTVEALEFVVKENDPHLLDIPFKDLALKQNLLICCLIRNGKVIIPNGSDCIKMDDHVVVVTTNKRLNDLRNILE